MRWGIWGHPVTNDARGAWVGEPGHVSEAGQSTEARKTAAYGRAAKTLAAAMSHARRNGLPCGLARRRKYSPIVGISPMAAGVSPYLVGQRAPL